MLLNKTYRKPWIWVIVSMVGTFAMAEIAYVLFALIFGVSVGGSGAAGGVMVAFLILLIIGIPQIFTFGCYIVYWRDLIADLNVVCREAEKDDTQRSPGFLVYYLLSLITIQIYPIFWMYRQGDRIQRAAAHYKENIHEPGTTYLLWEICQLVSLLLNIIAIGLTWDSLFTVETIFSFSFKPSGLAIALWIIGFIFSFGPYVAQYIFLNNFNKLSRAYNDQKNREIYGKKAETVPEKPAKTPVAEAPKTSGALVGISGLYQGARIPMEVGDILVLGRDTDQCNLVYTEANISRVHCKIRYNWNEKAYYIQDSSSNGVYLRGLGRIEKGRWVTIPSGSTITLGSTDNSFRLE